MEPPGAAASFYMSMGQAPPGSSPEMPTERKINGMRIPYRAEQVWLGIRHALAWHDKPEGDWTNVSFDKPLNRSDQPQPTVKLTTTADHEPKRDEKEAKGGRTKK